MDRGAGLERAGVGEGGGAERLERGSERGKGGVQEDWNGLGVGAGVQCRRKGEDVGGGRDWVHED